MHRIAPHRPSPALVVALIALFVSLAGGAYAAGMLPKGSVGTVQLRNGAVTSVKVKAHSLQAQDFKLGQLPHGARGATGATGASGATGTPGQNGLPGPSGDIGHTGPAGISNYQVVLFGESVQATDTRGEWDVSCPSGTNVLGGGVAVFNKNVEVESSTPLDDGTTWDVTVAPVTGSTFAGGGSAVNIRIVCATVASAS
jgi:hypothetical protein